MLSAGVDVKTVASRLGHADPALLFTTYSHFIASADPGRRRASGLAARVGAAANRLLASHGATRSTCGAARLRYTPSDVHKRTATDHGEPR